MGLAEYNELRSLESGLYAMDAYSKVVKKVGIISVVLSLDPAPSSSENYETNTTVRVPRDQIFHTLILQSASGTNGKVYVRIELNDSPIFPEAINNASGWVPAVGGILKIPEIMLITKEHDKLDFRAYSTDQIDSHEVSFVLS